MGLVRRYINYKKHNSLTITKREKMTELAIAIVICAQIPRTEPEIEDKTVMKHSIFVNKAQM
jgi:hypothetical protein